MHEHTFTIVVEWVWIPKLFKKMLPIAGAGIENSSGMKASVMMCPCGERKTLE